jgi:hypothetical protein
MRAFLVLAALLAVTVHGINNDIRLQFAQRKQRSALVCVAVPCCCDCVWFAMLGVRVVMRCVRCAALRLIGAGRGGSQRQG